MQQLSIGVGLGLVGLLTLDFLCRGGWRHDLYHSASLIEHLVTFADILRRHALTVENDPTLVVDVAIEQHRRFISSLYSHHIQRQ